MTRAEKLLHGWSECIPGDGVPCRDAILVLEHLGMHVRIGGRNHVSAFHRVLVGSDAYPRGTLTVNCHYRGRQGVAHPAAIRDIVRAARMLGGEE